MALQKLVFNWDKQGDYIRVNRFRNEEVINGDTRPKPFMSSVLVEVWENEEIRIAAKTNPSIKPVFTRGFIFNTMIVSTEDAYNKLKTLPEMVDAITKQ